jgi:hypothetical protein
MAELNQPSATAAVYINADPHAAYALVADLPTLASMAEETVAMRWRKGDSVRPGAVFTGHNQNGGRRWSTTCTVTDAEPGRIFAFDVRSAVIPVACWRYEFAVTGDRTAANREHIRLTLQRLKERLQEGGEAR